MIESTNEKEPNEELEQELIPEKNTNKMFSVVFPYQIKFMIPDNDDEHPPTEIIVTTHSQEFFSGRNEQDVLFQKENYDRYSKIRPIKYIKKFIWYEIENLNPEDAHLTFTGKPEVTEMSETRLATFQREIADNE